MARPRLTKKAGRRVQAVIRDAGDDDTVVQYRRVRPPYTAFGQTRWALDDQARFSAGLRCRPSSKPVRKLMGHITASQRWGLGKVHGAKFKGGWGPVGKGYLVRQMGTIRLADGRTYGVAIAVHRPTASPRAPRISIASPAGWPEGRPDSRRCG